MLDTYLSNRKQRVKINLDYSPWGDIKCGVPQGSILGPLLFNVFICDLFMFKPSQNIANYADDLTLYSAKQNNQLVIKDLEESSSILFKWLTENSMKINTDIIHLLMSGNDQNIAKIEEYYMSQKVNKNC